MDQKRVVIAIVVCAGILFAWAKFFPGAQPVPPAPSTVPSTTAQAPSAAPATAPANTAAAVGAGSGAAGSAPAAPAAYTEQETALETPVERFVFSNRGGVLKHAKLRATKYLAHANQPDSGIDLVRTTAPALAPLRVTFPKSAFPEPPDTAWQLVTPAAGAPANQVLYRAELPTVTIEKRFLVDSANFRLHLDVTVQNRTAAPQDHHLSIQVSGVQDQDSKGGFFSGASSNTTTALCHVGTDTIREDVEKLAKEPLSKTGAVGWIGADEKFFLTAVVPYPETPPRELTCTGRSAAPDTLLGELAFAERRVAPGARTTYSFAVFVGPKLISDLEQVRPGGREVELDKAVDVTLSQISRPMLWLLKFFHSFTKNWGVAIILLTVFIRLLTFYPTQRSLMSAKKMQKLGPKMAAIRKKYENDKQRQSAETMNLYKAHGVSPFGGCLPSLIQMPIWIALYSTLNYAVELYRSPFIFHLKDLTAKDPYYVTPLLMGGVMFVQMKMSPTSPDNQQQAMMAIMMPIMFTAFSLVLPSGLAVYMLTSYLIGILQQLWVNHLDRKANAPAPAPGRA
jgi:YidC/Oxa1 family membrane protein insertase